MMKMHTNHDNYMTAYDIANSLTPTLNVTRVNAMNTVIAQSEPTTLLGYTMVNDEAHPLAHIKITPLQEREKIIIDFGRHVTGYLHFTLGWKGEVMMPRRDYVWCMAKFHLMSRSRSIPMMENSAQAGCRTK